MAAIVSVVENIGSGARYLGLMMTVLTAASPTLSELAPSSATARCTMRRSYAFSGPISCGAPVRKRLAGEEPGHLLQLVVLVATEVLAIDQHAPFLSELPAKRGADNVLDGLQRLATLRQQQLAPLALEVDAIHVAGFGDHGPQRHAHGRGQLLKERREVLADVCAHTWPQALRASSDLPAPALFSRRSAGGRTCFTTGAPMMRLVANCWPMPSRLLTVQ